MLRRRMPLVAKRLPDPWPKDVTEAIRERDGNRCVGPVVGFPVERCIGSPQRDHIRASGALSMKSESTVANGVLLCAACHQWKTLNGRLARPVLIDYVNRKALTPHG